MIRYLLDTHIILWWLTSPEKVVPKVRKIISDRKNKIFLSSVSFWEMAIKQSLGRLTVPKNVLEVLISEGFEILHLTAEEGLSVSDLPFIHNDPFDRILIIQAKLNNLVFITNDSKILGYPVITIDASKKIAL